MEYKGYQGVVTFDDEANLFHGEVAGIRDVVTFQGATVDELRTAFKDSVDDYLAFCKEKGVKPNRPFSGHLTIRISPSLHRAIDQQARASGKGVDSWLSLHLSKLAAPQATE